MKYKLTDKSITLENGIKLYRIKALKSFSNVEKGDLGGFVESEYNLSHEGNCWIYDKAKVYNNAKVSDNAKIYGDAKVYGDAKIYRNAEISSKVQIYGGSWTISPICINLSKHHITFCSYSDIMIGCEIKTVNEWKQFGEKIGELLGVPNEEIELYFDAIILAEKHMEISKRIAK